MKASYHKHNDGTLNSSTYHKKDGTNVRTILKNDLKQELNMQKQFHCLWGVGYSFPCLKDVDSAFFNNSNGYEQGDIDAIEQLEIGETWISPSPIGEKHTVTRVHPDSYKQFSAEWGEGFVSPSTQHVVGSFFHIMNGYGTKDIEEIEALPIGGVWTAHTNEVHTVTRLK